MFDYVTVHLVLCRLKIFSFLVTLITAMASAPLLVWVMDSEPRPWVQKKSKILPWTLFVLDVILLLACLFYLIFVSPGDCGVCSVL